MSMCQWVVCEGQCQCDLVGECFFIKRVAFYSSGVKMAATEPVRSEVDKPEEDPVQEVILGEVKNAEDAVEEVILAVMKILLWEEEHAPVSKMDEYHNNLS